MYYFIVGVCSGCGEAETDCEVRSSAHELGGVPGFDISSGDTVFYFTVEVIRD